MRVMQFTIEGDAIISDYLYNGNEFIVNHDNTRDRFSASSDRVITTMTYKYLISPNRPQSTSTPGTASDAPPVYYLSNQENILTANPDGQGLMLIEDLWQMPPPSDTEL